MRLFMVEKKRLFSFRFSVQFNLTVFAYQLQVQSELSDQGTFSHFVICGFYMKSVVAVFVGVFFFLVCNRFWICSHDSSLHPQHTDVHTGLCGTLCFRFYPSHLTGIVDFSLLRTCFSLLSTITSFPFFYQDSSSSDCKDEKKKKKKKKKRKVDESWTVSILCCLK